MWFISGGGRVYIDCWRELDIIGEPAPTGLLILVQDICLYRPIYYKSNPSFPSQSHQLFHNPN